MKLNFVFLLTLSLFTGNFCSGFDFSNHFMDMHNADDSADTMLQDIPAVQAPGGIPGLTMDESDISRQQAIDLMIAGVYQHVLVNFNNEIKLFSQALRDNFDKINEYDQDAINQFNVFSQERLAQSIQVINRISNDSMNQYYEGLNDLGISSQVGVTDPIAKKLSREINSIEYEMIYQMRVAVEKIQFVDRLDDIAQEIQVGMLAYATAAEKDYAQRQVEALKVRKKSKWRDFKIAGNDFLGRLEVSLEKECKKAVVDAVSETINEVGQEAFDQATKVAGKALSDFGATYFGTDDISEQLAAKFSKYNETKLQDMFAVLPKSLQKQAFKQLGLSEDDDTMIAGLKAIIRKQYPVKQKFDNLQVRQSTSLCPAEQAFVQNRMPKVSKALKANFDIDAPLKVGLCTSGGGNRAMLVTLGFHLGAQDIGLLDSFLYTAGVSGSTWTISGWSYLNAAMGMSLNDFRDQIVNGPINSSMLTALGTSMPPLMDKDQQAMVGINAARHFAYDQNISTIDLYGAFIGNYTLLPAGKNRLNVTWSSIADTVKKGDMPLPMGSAVSYKVGQVAKGATEYHWYEVGPFEVGSDQVGAYVPTWAFGSKFLQGKPVDGYQGKAPEYPVSYFEGVFGSAFAASINEVVDQKLINPTFKMLGHEIVVPVSDWIKTSLLETVLDSRMYPATFHNYTEGLVGSPISNASNIRLYDGAMNINFPLPVLMRPARELDAVVVCDSGVDAHSLKSAQLHFTRNGQKFPDVSSYTDEKLASTPLTVLNDPRKPGYDKDMITILYCPFIKNSGYSTTFDPEVCMAKGECATFNFKYTSEQAARVIDLARYNVNQIQPEIKAVLKALQDIKK